MANRNRLIAVAAALVLAGCAGAAKTDVGDTDLDVVRAVDRSATPLAFTVCHGYGCWQRSAVGMTGPEWRSIQSIFESPAPDAEIERRLIAEAIARFERIVGPKTGTDADRPRAPFNLADLSQLDCVDESINTSTYLAMLHQAGFLRWHEPASPARRGSLLTLDIHFTATIRDMRGGAYYAVDSWFFANGDLPAVVRLDDWRAGWTADLAAPQSAAH